MLRLAVVTAVGLLMSSAVMADGHGHGHGHGHRHHHHHDRVVEVERVYYADPVVRYVAPAPVVVAAPLMAAPVPRHYSPDRRSATGLVGGALGSAVGYEMSRGDPLGAGLGAAAGAWMGNGLAR